MRHPSSVLFNKDQANEMAIFIAQLVREGVLFETETFGNGWVVILTGGY